MTGEDWQALLREASALRRAGRVDAAIAAYQRLLAINPALPDSWYNLGWLLRQARRFEEALAAYGEALKRGVDGAEEVHVNRAAILADQLARPEEARVELERALAANARYVPALLNLGNLAEDLGEREQARAAYADALEVEPGNALALSRLAAVSNVGMADDPLIERLRAALQDSRLPPSGRADIGFALVRLLDAAGAYDQAFEAATDANAASRASNGSAFRGYDRSAQEALVDRLIATFGKPAAPTQRADGPELVFICGMFRSGSTLTEQIFASHSNVQPGGELDLIPTMVDEELQPCPDKVAMLDPGELERLRESYLNELRRRKLTGPLVTDKRPDNFLHIGLIKTLFPAARIVHTRRAALDNLLSLYFLHLSADMAYAFDLDDAAHWLAQHDRLMAHWKALYPNDIHELDYDALIAEPRQRIESLLRFCGLDWEDSVLEFHAAANPVKTASVWQVRQPLHARSTGRWRNYEKQLGPLAQARRPPEDS